VKYVPAIDIELTPAGPVYKGSSWPDEIVVERGLVDYPQGPHAQFGRKGALAFICINGNATYRRFEDRHDGWLCKLVDSRLVGAAPLAAAATHPAEPRPAAAVERYQLNGKTVEAFQWLPHAVPPVDLPAWFIKSDFKQNKDGQLVIRQPSGPVRARPSDWIVLRDGRLEVVDPSMFSQFTKAA
jgi:hypothetical protein